MENASKALIIAGAILLSILIIGLGMFIYNQAAGVMGDTGLDAQQIQSYNEPFERYEGPNVKGSTVKAMIDTVRNHNNANISDPSKQILVQNSTATEGTAAPSTALTIDYVTLKAGVQSGKQYVVTTGHDSNTGLVTVIGFVEVS